MILGRLSPVLSIDAHIFATAFSASDIGAPHRRHTLAPPLLPLSPAVIAIPFAYGRHFRRRLPPLALRVVSLRRDAITFFFHYAIYFFTYFHAEFMILAKPSLYFQPSFYGLACYYSSPPYYILRHYSFRHYLVYDMPCRHAARFLLPYGLASPLFEPLSLIIRSFHVESAACF